jgi:clan AA aspartic protease (TIGR02281 family)
LTGILAQAFLLVPPGHTATYRCYDDSGAPVLTDNPAQLFDCTMLPSSLNGASPGLPVSPNESSPISNAEQHETQQRDSQPSREKYSQNEKPSGGEISVPLTSIGGSLVVRVLLNQERSAQLIVDTGASMTVLSMDVALDLGILGTTENELLTVNTAGGSVQVNMNYLSSLSVGSAQATNVAVAIHDLPEVPEPIEGLLGMSFLKHFLVTLDSDHARLILRPKGQP